MFTDDQWFHGSIELFDDGTFKERYAGCMGWWSTEGTWRNNGKVLLLDIVSGQDRWSRARTQYNRVEYLGDGYLIPTDWDAPHWSKGKATERGYLKLGW